MRYDWRVMNLYSVPTACSSQGPVRESVPIRCRSETGSVSGTAGSGGPGADRPVAVQRRADGVVDCLVRSSTASRSAAKPMTADLAGRSYWTLRQRFAVATAPSRSICHLRALTARGEDG